jgi:hypothetical protein
MMKALQNLILLIGLFLTSCESADGQKQDQEKPMVVDAAHFQMPNLPDSMTFAGEMIDLTDWDVKERLDKELHAIVYYHNLIIPCFKRSNRFFPTIEKLLKENDLPDDFKYLAVIESGLENVTSPSGAQGFWQFMPFTAKEYGMTVNSYIDERNDLSKSTPAAAKYLIKAKDSLSGWVDAAASYNRGAAGFNRDKSWQKSSSFFDTYLNGETSRYVFRILAMKLIFENPEKYGYDLNKIEMYQPYETKEIRVEGAINDLAVWAKQNGINYKILVKLNPWIIGNSLPKRTENYIILLPVGDSQLRNFRN